MLGTLQSRTGKYRGLQGNPCNENRDPAMRNGVPCNENKFFPVGIGSQGVPCELYTLISLINVEPTLTDFEKFHPPQCNGIAWFVG